MKNGNDKRKITVQVWGPVLKKLNELATAACLNRDAYLDVVFANEAAILQQERGTDINSDAARRYIKKSLLELKHFVPVSLNLSRETADAIDAVCDAVNVGRDSFINRTLLLLVARPEVCEAEWGLKLADYREEIFDAGNDIKGLLLSSPLTAIRALIGDDPFFAWRIALKVGESECLHRMLLGRPHGKTQKERGRLGFNVYISDMLVPGTDAKEQWDEEMAEMFDLVETPGSKS